MSESERRPSAASKPVVSFLGPVTSYSHQAVLQAFSADEWDLRPAPSINDVFGTVQRGNAALGLIPFENSTFGPVSFTLDCLADRSSRLGDVIVCGEVYLAVHHYLIGRLPPASRQAAPDPGSSTPTPADPEPRSPLARPLTSLAHIQRVYSHPQAFGQCSSFLATYLRSAEVMEVSSTSRAAEMVHEAADSHCAAISSRLAASLYGLDLLAHSIEDRQDNTTRFFIIRSASTPSAIIPTLFPLSQVDVASATSLPHSSSLSSSASSCASPKSKTLVSFTVPHHSPGALANVLDCFRAHSLNLTSINSRPSLEEPFHYIFFVECEGHRGHDPDGRVRGALEAVAALAESWRWLGSWHCQPGC